MLLSTVTHNWPQFLRWRYIDWGITNRLPILIDAISLALSLYYRPLIHFPPCKNPLKSCYLICRRLFFSWHLCSFFTGHFFSPRFRNICVRDWVERIEAHDGGLKDFSQAYKYYGLHFQQDNSVIAREWAPGAVQVYITGDFSECSLFYYSYYIVIFFRI